MNFIATCAETSFANIQQHIPVLSLIGIFVFVVLFEHKINKKSEEMDLANQNLKHELKELHIHCYEMVDGVICNLSHVENELTDLKKTIEYIEHKMDDVISNDIADVMDDIHILYNMCDKLEQTIKDRPVELALRKLHDEHSALHSKYAVMQSQFREIEKQCKNEYVLIGFNRNVPLFVKSNVKTMDELLFGTDMFSRNMFNLKVQEAHIGIIAERLSKTEVKVFDLEAIAENMGHSETTSFTIHNSTNQYCNISYPVYSKTSYMQNNTDHFARSSKREAYIEQLNSLKNALNKYNIELVLPNYIEQYLQ